MFTGTYQDKNVSLYKRRKFLQFFLSLPLQIKCEVATYDLFSIMYLKMYVVKYRVILKQWFLNTLNTLFFSLFCLFPCCLLSSNNVTDSNEVLLRPFSLMPLFGGGTFDKRYNERYQPIKFHVPPSTKKVKNTHTHAHQSWITNTPCCKCLSSCLFALHPPGGAVCCHHGPRLRRQQVRGVLCHLALLLI